jgi:hypothetical protein
MKGLVRITFPPGLVKRKNDQVSHSSLTVPALCERAGTACRYENHHEQPAAEFLHEELPPVAANVPAQGLFPRDRIILGMPVGYLIRYLLAASVMLVDVVHAAPAAAEEMRTEPGAAIAWSQAANHERECVGAQRGCMPRPDAVAPAHAFQPGAMAPAGRPALPTAILALPSRAAPCAAQPLSILFCNFRS